MTALADPDDTDEPADDERDEDLEPDPDADPEPDDEQLWAEPEPEANNGEPNYRRIYAASFAKGLMK